jgi:hypothetical protein
MDLDSISKDTCQNLSDGAFGNLFLNPIYVALLITSIVILIVLCMYGERKLVKTSVYIFLATLTIVFIHNNLLLIEHRKQLCDKDTDDICKNIDAGPNMSGGYSLEGGLDYLHV